MNPGLTGLMDVKVTEMIEFPAPSPCFPWASWRCIKFELWGSPAGMQWSQGSRKGGQGWAKAGMGEASKDYPVLLCEAWPTHPSLWDTSHNAVLPLGCKVGDALPSSTSVPGEVTFLGVGCVAPSPFKPFMLIKSS